jgi:hypothetical protein
MPIRRWERSGEAFGDRRGKRRSTETGIASVIVNEEV